MNPAYIKEALTELDGLKVTCRIESGGPLVITEGSHVQVIMPMHV